MAIRILCFGPRTVTSRGVSLRSPSAIQAPVPPLLLEDVISWPAAWEFATSVDVFVTVISECHLVALKKKKKKSTYILKRKQIPFTSDDGATSSEATQVNTFHTLKPNNAGVCKRWMSTLPVIWHCGPQNLMIWVPFIQAEAVLVLLELWKLTLEIKKRCHVMYGNTR